jgi:stage V sporulation protein G
LKITSVNVRKVEKEDSRMKAYASVLLDDCFIVRDLKVIEGENGLFVAMPSRKTPTGLFHDIVHPINQETRKMFEDAILEAYKNAE